MRNDSRTAATERTRNLSQERRATRETEEAAVGPLLARANLLRMRRQWDEAIAVCTEALRRAPESSTAHSLMGDIYEAQGKTDDAVQWFSMAVDLAPDNAADRQKLERAVAARRAVLAAEPRLSGAVPAPSGTGDAAAAARRGPDRTAVLSPPEPARRTAELTIDWFDRVFPPGRAEGIARMILALCAVLAVLLVGAAGFLYLSFSREVAGTDPPPAASKPRSEVAAAAPTVPVMEVGARTSPAGPPAANDAAAGARRADGSAAARPAAPGPLASARASARTAAPTPAPPAPPDALSNASRLKMLRAELDRALPNTVTLADVQFDPQQARLTCDLLVSLNSGEAPALARERILRAAVFVGRNATLHDARVQRVAVQVRPRLTGAYDATRPSSAVFLGETTAALLREADPVTGSGPELRSLFAYSWWSPEFGQPADAVGDSGGGGGGNTSPLPANP